MGTGCMTQGTQTGALWQAESWNGEKEGREGGSGERERGCIFGWFLLMYDRKPKNSVKQLSFSKKKKKKN